MDVIGPLPLTLAGNRYIIVAVDFLTRWVEAEALPEANAQAIADFLHKDIISQYWVSDEITTDQGTEFVNEFHQVLYCKFKIKHIKTIVYHSQENGQTEWINKILKNILAKIIDKYNHWDHYLPATLSVMQNIQSVSTKFILQELVFSIGDQTIVTEINIEAIWLCINAEITKLYQVYNQAYEFILKT